MTRPNSERTFRTGVATVPRELAVRQSATIVRMEELSKTKRFTRHDLPPLKSKKKRDMTAWPVVFFLFLRILPALLCILAGFVLIAANR